MVEAYRYFAVDRMVERNESFSAGNTRNHLYLFVQQLHEMLIVAGIELDEHGIRAGSEVTFHDLGNLLYLGHYVAVHGTALQINTYICAGGITEYLGIDMITGTCDHIHIYEALKALMDGGTRHSAFHCHVFRRDAGVVHHYLKYFSVEIVNFFHDGVVFVSCILFSLANIIIILQNEQNFGKIPFIFCQIALFGALFVRQFSKIRQYLNELPPRNSLSNDVDGSSDMLIGAK